MTADQEIVEDNIDDGRCNIGGHGNTGIAAATLRCIDHQ